MKKLFNVDIYPRPDGGPIPGKQTEMPRIPFIFTFIIMAVMAGFAGCASPDRELVDQRYLDSGMYNSFKKQADREQKEARKQKGGIIARLKTIAACSVSQSLIAPSSIDSLTISEWSELEGSNCFNGQPPGEASYSLKAVAQTPVNNVRLVWVLHSRRSVYQNQELLIATYRGQKFLNAESIGMYRKNLKEKISTDIEVIPEDENLMIVAVENRKITYPFEQINSIKNVYRIGRNGVIEH